MVIHYYFTALVKPQTQHMQCHDSEEQEETNHLIKPIKTRLISDFRKKLKRQFFNRRFGGSGWLQFLQAHKKETLLQSQSFRRAVKEYQDLTCPICFNLMMFPVLLECGHAFCKPCIEQATLLLNRCCLCRANNYQLYFTPCQMISNIIQTISLQWLSSEEKLQYWRRYCDYDLWDHMTMINPHFKIGEPVHFFDEEKKGWRYGVINKVRVQAEKELYFIIKPLYYSNHLQSRKTFKFHYLSRKVSRFQFFLDCDLFRREWEQYTLKYPNPKSRDQVMTEIISQRIKKKRIKDKHDTTGSKFGSLYSQKQNLMIYFPGWNSKKIMEINNYTFDEFHGGTYIKSQQRKIAFSAPFTPFQQQQPMVSQQSQL